MADRFEGPVSVSLVGGQILVLLGSVVTSSAAALARARHSPIDIDSDAEMVPPDRVSNNGVRSGTGTEADPWVISNWSIQAPEQGPAIDITNVQGHFLIRNVKLQMGSGGRSMALDLVQNENARIENVTITGHTEGQPVFIHESSVKLDNLSMNATSTRCLQVHSSDVQIQRLDVEGLCGDVALSFQDTNVVADHVRLNSVAGGISVGGEAKQVTFENVLVTRSNQSTWPENPDLSIGRTGIEAQTGGIEDLRMRDIQVRGFYGACLSLDGSPTGDESFRAIDVADCGEDRASGGIVVQSRAGEPLKLRGVTVSNSTVGVLANNGTVDLEDATIRGTRLGLVAVPYSSGSGQPRIEATNVQFENTGIDARARPPGEIVLDQVTSDEFTSEGEVIVSSAAAPGGSGNEVRAPGVVAIVATAVALAWLRRG